MFTGKRSLFLLAFLFLFPALAAAAPQQDAPASAPKTLLILHTNDTHAHVAGNDRHGSPTFEETGSQGGYGRIAAAIRTEKQNRPDGHVIALDAGDQWQGSLFYSLFRQDLLTALDPVMPYDAITLGNHEWDEGCRTLADFLPKQTIPVVAANLAPKPGCPLHEVTAVRPWIIKEAGDMRVGIIGLANDEPDTSSSACPQTAFRDAAQTLRQSVRELQDQGIKYIIALTHLGYPRDQELAKAVDGIDVIVGGHTHTYLGSDSPKGPYPTVVTSPSGHPVLVVQAWWAAQLLGRLEVTFDEAGIPVSWTGAAQKLDPSMPVAPDVARIVAGMRLKIDDLRAEPVGTAQLDGMPDGPDACRAGYCFSGPIVARAFLAAAKSAGAEIALVNAGGIRAPMADGTVTTGNILTIMPFANVLVLKKYTGATLVRALEHGVAGTIRVWPHLLFTAGLSYTVTTSAVPGHRVSDVMVVGADGSRTPIVMDKEYVVCLSNFLARGGDKFSMLKDDGKDVTFTSPIDADAVLAYLKLHSPLTAVQDSVLVRD